MPSLLPLACPNCHSEMVVRANSGVPYPSATRFEDCIRQCAACEIGASNAGDSSIVTYIHRDPLQNIPAEVRAGAASSLDEACNVRNRATKRLRFGFSTSEDAVTWVVFAYLLRARQLVPVLVRLGLVTDGGEVKPGLLLWGSVVDGDAAAENTRNKLLKTCRSLNEDSQSFSEPDVIVELGQAGLIFIEVKYLSGNDWKQSDYRGWDRYMPAALGWNENAVRASGCYELARNWRLMAALANGRRATLVNLGMPQLFSGAEGRRLDSFRDALASNDQRRFVKLTWSTLVSAIAEPPQWFLDYCRSRRLVN